MRSPLETKTLVTNQPLNPGLNQISTILPVGELWKAMVLTFKHAVTIGTGAGAIALGEYRIVNSINLKTDKNEVVCDNVPGLGLYPIHYRHDRVAPFNVPVVAGTATYLATIKIPFGLSWLNKPEDFYINSRRYKSLELTITMGGPADLYAAPGTATVISTVDISLVRSNANLWAPDKRAMNLSLPHKIPYFKHLPVLDPTAIPYWDLESAEDFWITDFQLSMGDTTAVPGVPYSGTPIDGIDGVSFEDNVHTFLAAVPVEFFVQLRRKLLGADLPGAYLYTFIPNGSYREAYKTKQKSELKLRWNAAAGAAVVQADLVLIGYRTPKA
jgi:hypothetical protein